MRRIIDPGLLRICASRLDHPWDPLLIFFFLALGVEGGEGL